MNGPLKWLGIGAIALAGGLWWLVSWPFRKLAGKPTTRKKAQ